MPIKIHHQLTDDASFAGGWFSIGNFDGVHRGHRAMISLLVENAKRDGLPSVVFTFDPPPVALLAPERVPPQLSSIERKAELLEPMGVTDLLVFPTHRELLELSAQEFFDDVIRGKLNAQGLVEGPNFFFGKNRTGNVEMLKRLCEAASITCEIVAPIETNGNLISSTCIRNMIKTGQIDRAIEMLGHPYQIHGLVTEGSKRGRELGFPTANLVQIPTLVPGEGVYSGTTIVDGNAYAAAIHIGPNPTFDEFNKKVEVHIIDFHGDLYGTILTVDFIKKLREIHPFSDSQELIGQLRRDIEQARKSAAKSLKGNS